MPKISLANWLERKGREIPDKSEDQIKQAMVDAFAQTRQGKESYLVALLNIDANKATGMVMWWSKNVAMTAARAAVNLANVGPTDLKELSRHHAHALKLMEERAELLDKVAILDKQIGEYQPIIDMMRGLKVGLQRFREGQPT